jgi:murein DD-endopeptidase MepM/ murein hydrolase activator NlpD
LRNNFKKLSALFIVIVFLIGIILPVYADELEEQQRKLQDVSRQINQQQKKINQVKNEENTILGQLQRLEQSISEAESEIEALAARIDFLQESISQNEKEIKELEEELAYQTGILSERLVFIYEKGDVSYLEVLLSSIDIKDFLIRYDMLSIIVNQDMELIEIINKKKEELDNRKKELESQKKELEKIQESQVSKKAELDSQLKQREDMLSSTRQERDTYERAVKELEKTSRELESMIRNIQTGGSNEQLGSGIYTWPTPGYSRISSNYGMRWHPILKENRMHTGVDIAAPMGAKIVAADSGTVIFAGWSGGYGQVIIIDHGGGISTLYAHQSTLLAGKGTAVAKGQQIGKVGSTGWSTGPHLHFEVRINGKYTNPLSYIK